MVHIETEKLVGSTNIKEILVNHFSWVGDEGVVVNAGSTVGGAVGHDVDIMIMFNNQKPEMITDNFVKSMASMDEVLTEADRIRPSFSFSRVAWQDFMSEFRKLREPERGEPLGIHFLWYASPEQLLISEPRGLALGLVNGEVLLGNRQLVKGVVSGCPDKDTCDLWTGMDNILDPVRLISNPKIEFSKLSPTIGHTIERFVTWNILAERVRHKKGFDLVTRSDIKQELDMSDDFIKHILVTARQLRDEPGKVDRCGLIELTKQIFDNWNDIRRVK